MIKSNQSLKFYIAFLIPAGIYLLKVNKRNTRTRCEICSKLTIMIPERHHIFPRVKYVQS